MVEWVSYYNREKPQSALESLHPIDYYRGNPQALLAERKALLNSLSRVEARRLEDFYPVPEHQIHQVSLWHHVPLF